MNEIRAQIDRQVPWATIRKMQEVGRQFDVNKNGLYDSCGGCINIWCSPDDKPADWDVPITPGGFDYPREYVGDLSWERVDGQHDLLNLFVEATPYELLKRRKAYRSYDWSILGPQIRENLLNWLRQKAAFLLRLAELHPDVIGTRCSFCEFLLPTGELLNDLLDHIAAEHPQVVVKSLMLGDPCQIVTEQGTFKLEAVEKF